MLLKLDLHTHCHEALGFEHATPETVEKILDRCVARGLDGLAITDHSSSTFAYQVLDVVAAHFADCGLIIIPGNEVRVGLEEVVELYLPNDTTFRFWAHPQFWHEDVGVEVRGIEIENGMHQIDKARVAGVAAARGLRLMYNSDAHYIDDIGRYYNEIEWDDLLSLGTP